MNTRAKVIAIQYLLMALLVVAVRALFRFLFGGLSLAAFWLGLKDGLWLSIGVLGFGVLNLTFDFSKLAGRLPGRLGTALSIAINLVPEQARSIGRIRYASGLRARRRGSNLLRSVIAPVLRSSVDGSLELAASMETRGFGKFNQQQATVPGGIRFSYRAGATKYSSHNFRSGTVTLISGPTGSGKSTILKIACGLAPHFSGGLVSQRTPQPSELSGSIAYVGQNPSHSFVAATVFDELAFAPNQLNLPPTQIEPIAKRFGLSDKFQMDPRTLSAGWQQRVAIAAALTSGAKTLLLDEPFSMLDSEGREVLDKLLSELKALGYAIAIAEHRTSLLEGLVDEELSLGEPATRKKKAQIRKSSAELHNFQPVSVAYGQNKVFEGFEVSIPKASVSTVTGPNGSGKSSLLRALAKQNAALVPQPASDLLFMNSVSEELEQSDRDNRNPLGTAEELLKRLVPEIPLENNPTDLSEGQKLALAIAIQLGQNRPILLLDEPTVGFDDVAKHRLSDLLRQITKHGKTVLLATHDHEFAKGISTNTINLGGANVR